jgi:uncharacterized protein YkwD
MDDDPRDLQGPTPIEPARRRPPSLGFLVALGCLAAVAVALALGLALRPSALAGFPPLLGAAEPLYPPHDPWSRYLADERTCPGGEAADAPLAAQVETMLCLVDYARLRRGLRPLPVSTRLTVSASIKGGEVQRCGTFAHAPCGGDPDEVARTVRYDGAFGENLYIGEGRTGAPRVAMDGWLNSRGHRENLFRREWRVQSLYVAKVPQLRTYRDATLWVSHFGDR